MRRGSEESPRGEAAGEAWSKRVAGELQGAARWAPPGQGALEIERIKQYPGLQQVQRAVVVNVPGKHFPQLQAAEQKVDYSGTRYGRRAEFTF